MIRWRYLAFIIVKLDLNIISVKHIEVFLKNHFERKKNTPVNTDVINGSMIFSVVTQMGDNTEYLFLSSK